MQKRPNTVSSDDAPGKRTQPKRILMKDLVIKKVGKKTVGYFFMIVTSPAKRGSESEEKNIYQGLLSPDIENAPWVTIRDRYHRDQMITFPITLCGIVNEHLQSMVRKQGGDWSFDVTKLKPFQVSEPALNIYIECPITSEQKKITEDADSKEKRSDLIDPDEKKVWLRSGPEDPSKADNMNSRLTYLRVYEELVPNLLAFLLDIRTRYSQRDVGPDKAVSMLSDSGERRFFFDVRNTRYGYRLHISQVSNKNRMVIGIPLESVVMARDCLNEVIRNYQLAEDTDRAALRKYCTNVILVRRSRRANGNETPEERPSSSPKSDSDQKNQRKAPASSKTTATKI